MVNIMKKNLKAIFTIFTVLTLALGLCACQPPKATKIENPEEAMAINAAKELAIHGQAVKKGEDTDVFKKNPITVETIEINSYEDDEYGSYVRISGLKDKEIEKKINRQIKDAFYELYEDTELPKYQGIEKFKRSMEEENYKHIRSVFTYENFNAFNIYSLKVNRYDSYSNSKGSFGYGKNKNLNFNLATGELLNLKDVFEDNFEYVTFINDNIREHIINTTDLEYFEYDSNTIWFKPNFKTVAADTDFGISGYSGSIALTFDDETPYAVTSYYPEEYLIDLGELSAISKRCMSDEDIFEDSSYGIIFREKDVSKYEKDYFYEEDYDHIETKNYGKAGIYSHIFVNKEAPEEIVDIAKKFYNDKTFFTDNKGFDFYDNMKIESCWGNVNVSTSHVSHYWMLNCYRAFTGSSDTGETRENFENKKYVFDEKSDKFLEFEDVFKKDVDIKKAFVNAVLADYEQKMKNNEQMQYAYDAHDVKKLAELLYEDLDGFYIGPAWFSFSFKDKKKVVKDFMGDSCYEDRGYRLYMFVNEVAVAVDYKYFDIENLIL